MRVVFIASGGWSGTTLLEQALSQFDGVVSVGELYWLWRPFWPTMTCECGQPFASCEFWQAALTDAYGRDHAWVRARVDRLGSGFGHHSIGSALSASTPRFRLGAALEELGALMQPLYDSVTSLSGAGAVVDTSKIGLWGLSASKGRAIDLRVVHLVRNPRGFVLSDTRPRADRTYPAPANDRGRHPARSALSWLLINGQAELLARGAGAHATVLYEDLAADPAGTVARVARFCGLDDARPPIVRGALVVAKVGHAIGGHPDRPGCGATPIASRDLPERTFVPTPVAVCSRVVTPVWRRYERRAGTELRVRVVRPRELGPAELDRWRELQRGDEAFCHPFLGWDFARAVDAVRPRARVAIVEDGPRVVGFLAFELGRFGEAVPIGGSFNYRQAFVHERGLDWSWSGLMRSAGLHTIAFSELVDAQAAGERRLRAGTSPIIDTTVAWETYLKGARSHKQIRTTLYKSRRLEREIGAVEFTWPTSTLDDLARLIAWKSRQYRRSGWRDPFARPWVRGLLDVLTSGPPVEPPGQPTAELHPILTSLRAAGRLVAVDLSLRSGAVLAGWLSAYDPQFGAFSPGAIRMLRAIEHACDSDIAHIDMARGDEPYKQSLKTGDATVGVGYVQVRSTPAAAYRAVRAPTERAESYVLSHPRLRNLVRSTLRTYGAARA